MVLQLSARICHACIRPEQYHGLVDPIMLTLVISLGSNGFNCHCQNGLHVLIVVCLPVQAQNANMDGSMLDLYPSPADLRKQQVADIQAKRQEKVLLLAPYSNPLPPAPHPTPLLVLGSAFDIQHHAALQT